MKTKNETLSIRLSIALNFHDKHKSKVKEIEGNFRPPSYGSPWACGIWHTFCFHWACFKAGRRICPQFQFETDQMYIEAKLTKVKQDMEALENKKRSYDSIFKGIRKQHMNKTRRKKESRRKLNEGKRTRTENKFQRVSLWNLCLKPAKKRSSTPPCVPS